MRKIPIFRVQVGADADYSRLTKIPGVVDVVMDETIKAIKEGIDKNKKTVSLFEVDGCDYYINLDKEQWKHTLVGVLDKYIEKEEYIKCKEVKELIDRL